MLPVSGKNRNFATIQRAYLNKMIILDLHVLNIVNGQLVVKGKTCRKIGYGNSRLG